MVLTFPTGPEFCITHRYSIRWQHDVDDVVDQFVLHDAVARGSRAGRKRFRGFELSAPEIATLPERR